LFSHHANAHTRMHMHLLDVTNHYRPRWSSSLSSLLMRAPTRAPSPSRSMGVPPPSTRWTSTALSSSRTLRLRLRLRRFTRRRLSRRPRWRRWRRRWRRHQSRRPNRQQRSTPSPPAVLRLPRLSCILCRSLQAPDHAQALCGNLPDALCRIFQVFCRPQALCPTASQPAVVLAPLEVNMRMHISVMQCTLQL